MFVNLSINLAKFNTQEQDRFAINIFSQIQVWKGFFHPKFNPISFLNLSLTIALNWFAVKMPGNPWSWFAVKIIWKK
jgi:hypothetical protein